MRSRILSDSVQLGKIFPISLKSCFGFYLLTFGIMSNGFEVGRHFGLNTDNFYQTSDTVKVDSFLMTFTSLYTHTTPVLESSKCYYMTIEGRYHHASDGRGSDGAWHYCYYECAVSGNCNYDTPCSSLDSTSWNFFITSMRPVEDIYQPDHVYEYRFVGADTAMVFNWEDCCYGDNGGSLTVRIFEVDCLDTLNTVGTQIDQENLFINSPGINGLIMKDENGDCWKLTISTSGVLTTRKVICPE